MLMIVEIDCTFFRFRFILQLKTQDISFKEQKLEDFIYNKSIDTRMEKSNDNY